ncbi:restriction endonuclease subunit S [Streptococcus infantarius]|uniref:restriction endonuclease subunit S n=1 Tax=Streptococcus infantarius TaxID=102684 RepID=UPI0022E92DC2|nr:restriction endonuclease subunit S [Streptococcus infantarius]
MKTNSVPKIRFKGFTDDWEQRKLGEIAERVQGNDGRMDLPTLTISAANGWMDQKERFSGNIAGKEQKKYTLLHKGELSYNHGNSKLAKYGTVFSLETYEEALVPRVYHSFKVINGSSKFIEYYFATKIPDRELAKLVSSGARMDGLLNINFNEFMGINLTVPNKSEQEKISNYFSNLDHLITLHQRKCEQTKELKKFMLQKMFPKKGEKNPEIRFPGFTDDWEQRKLGELGRATGGTSIESEFSENGKYKVISIGSYSEDSVYREQGIRAIESEKTKNRVLNEGDLTMILNDKTTSGNIIGRVLLIEKSDVYVYNQRTERIEINHDKFDSLFVYEMLNAPQIRNKIIKQSQGNTQIYVNWPAIAETRYLIPQIDEQQKIGEYFSNLDRLITLHQRKCEQLKELKKFMLQNMFPKKG